MIMRIDLTEGSRGLFQFEEVQTWTAALDLFLDTMRGMGYIFNFTNDDASEALLDLHESYKHE